MRARDREHAQRDGDQARRHHHPAQRQDGRGQQHRRRGPPDPRRRAHLLRRELGAERIVDLATLTGAVLVALGSTYAGLISNDDDWAEQVRGRRRATGELAWRLPLHPEYKELTKGTVADLTNASAKRKAGTIYAASFLEEFVDGKPWVHLDIAGTAWDVGREYVGNGPDRLRRAAAGRALARRLAATC